MLRVAASFLGRSTWRGVCPSKSLRRAIATGSGNGNGKKTTEYPSAIQGDTTSQYNPDDEFTSIAEVSDDAFQEQSSPEDALRKLAEVPPDIAPHLAKELVERIVAAAGQSVGSAVVPPLTITPHVLRVMRAARVVTHDVIGPLSRTGRYPIRAKVTIHVDLDVFGLSGLASAALEQIAGPRIKENILTVNSQKYRTSAENQVDAVAKISQAIAESMIAVGETVDETSIESWDTILATVSSMTAEDQEETQSLVKYVSGLPEPTLEPCNVPSLVANSEDDILPSILGQPYAKPEKASLSAA